MSSELSKEVLESEFSHVNGVTYLDHAGATLYSSRQLEDHVRDLSSSLYSNPHSGSPSSLETTALVESTRELVLRHFSTTSEDYQLVFTAGCTAALNLLSHAFPWQGSSDQPHPQSECRSVFCYLDDNHTSVVGMREVARQRGARTLCVSAQDIHPPASPHAQSPADQPHPTSPAAQPLPPDSHFCASQPLPPHPVAQPFLPTQPHNRSPEAQPILPPSSPPTAQPHPPANLFAFPAQSNFSGHKYPLTWCSDIPQGVLTLDPLAGQRGSWYVVLDAASHVSTSPLDLSLTTPDFITLSFYKLFGFPTGLGALLVHRDAAGILRKPYYGGGTVKASDSWTDFHVPKDKLHDRLEDGTLPYLEILALRHGFATLNRLGGSMQAIQLHTFNLARRVYKSLSELRHSNGGKVCVLYSETNFDDSSKQGPIVNFNLLRADGRFLGYHQVEKLAAVCNIHLRTGCFCNTGACMKFLGLDSEKLKYHFSQGHECGDAVDLVDGCPTGSVRISLGYMSTHQDVTHFLHFIKTCFVDSSKELKPFKEQLNPKQSSLDFPAQEATGALPLARAVSNDFPETGPALVSCGDMVSVTPSLAETGPAQGPVSRPAQGPVSRPAQSPVSRPAQSPVSLAGLAGGPAQSPVALASSSHLAVRPATSGSCTSYESTAVVASEKQATAISNCTLTLKSITLFPLKSCAGFSVRQWPLGEKGLLYDREWMVVSSSGSLLTQKQEPRLHVIQPSIDLDRQTLTLVAAGCEVSTAPVLSLSHPHPQGSGRGTGRTHTRHGDHAPPLSTRVCGDRVVGLDCGDEVAQWLTSVLGRQCRLLRQNPHQRRCSRAPNSNKQGPLPSLSLANEAQYLLLARGSLEQLLRELQETQPDWTTVNYTQLASRFRANFVVSGEKMEAFAEESWEEVHIGSQLFQVSGMCVRCQMVCLDPTTGKRTPEPLKTLFALRGSKAYFGIYLRHTPSTQAKMCIF